jgi:hypothetical protein
MLPPLAPVPQDWRSAHVCERSHHAYPRSPTVKPGDDPHVEAVILRDVLKGRGAPSVVGHGKRIRRGDAVSLSRLAGEARAAVKLAPMRAAPTSGSVGGPRQSLQIG